MAGKKKKKGARPGIAQQDSLRKDIEESKSQTLSALSEDGTGEEDAEGLDIADQLLATLDARDKATQEQLTPTAHSNSSQRRTSNLSGTSGQSQTSLSQTSGVSTSSPVKGAAEKIVHAGEKLFGNHSSETASALQPSVDGEPSEDLQNKGHFKSLFTSSGSKTGSAGFPDGLKKTSRQKARKDRKAAEMEAKRLEAEEELKANGGKPDEAEREKVAISELCNALHVQMKEMTPDGHCLYAAVADQLNVLGKNPERNLGYTDARKATADFMRSNPDDFMPFISDSDEHMAGIVNTEAGSKDADGVNQQQHFMRYCDAVENTAVWGGQPEILALSRAFHTPIHVIQAGMPVLKVGTDEGLPSEDPVIISYHRHMYGLGEHYNSLRKKTS